MSYMESNVIIVLYYRHKVKYFIFIRTVIFVTNVVDDKYENCVSEPRGGQYSVSRSVSNELAEPETGPWASLLVAQHPWL